MARRRDALIHCVLHLLEGAHLDLAHALAHRAGEREVTEPGPRSCRPNSVASEASRISPTVFHPTAVTAFLILVENRTFSMGVSSGSFGAGYPTAG
jgi:hypothetical protein